MGTGVILASVRPSHPAYPSQPDPPTTYQRSRAATAVQASTTDDHGSDSDRRLSLPITKRTILRMPAFYVFFTTDGTKTKETTPPIISNYVIQIFNVPPNSYQLRISEGVYLSGGLSFIHSQIIERDLITICRLQLMSFNDTTWDTVQCPYLHLCPFINATSVLMSNKYVFDSFYIKVIIFAYVLSSLRSTASTTKTTHVCSHVGKYLRNAQLLKMLTSIGTYLHCERPQHYIINYITSRRILGHHGPSGCSKITDCYTYDIASRRLGFIGGGTLSSMPGAKGPLVSGHDKLHSIKPP